MNKVVVDSSPVSVTLLLLFDNPQKTKAEYTVLCLNALVNFQKASVASRHLDLMSNFLICSHMSIVNGFLLVRFRWCAEYEIL